MSVPKKSKNTTNHTPPEMYFPWYRSYTASPNSATSRKTEAENGSPSFENMVFDACVCVFFNKAEKKCPLLTLNSNYLRGPENLKP